MKSNEILYSNGNNDECHTSDYAVIPIMEYIPKDAVVWCPFDTEESRFVNEIAKTNKVEFSHISNGQDFYKYEPEKWDIIISNPPYTNKRKIFERCLAFNKPFALLMSNTWLNDAAPKQLFMQKDLQLLMFDKRIQYDKGGGVPFGSSYYCHRLLPKQIVFEELAVCRNDYSRMHRDVDNLNRNIAEEDTGLSLVV